MYAPTHKKALKPEDIADTIAFVLSTPPTVTVRITLYLFILS